jgi:hypothetical protein
VIWRLLYWHEITVSSACISLPKKLFYSSAMLLRVQEGMCKRCHYKDHFTITARKRHFDYQWHKYALRLPITWQQAKKWVTMYVLGVYFQPQWQQFTFHCIIYSSAFPRSPRHKRSIHQIFQRAFPFSVDISRSCHRYFHLAVTVMSETAKILFRRSKEIKDSVTNFEFTKWYAK